MRYIFFLPNADYYKYAYRELEDQQSTILVFNVADNRNIIFRRLHDLFRVLRLSTVFPSLGKIHTLDDDLLKDDKICFIFSARLLEASYCYNYVLSLKRIFPQSKFVLYYQDIITSFKNYVHPNNVKRLFDLMISYNRIDSNEYNINYFPTSFSIQNENNDSITQEFDVYFLGRAKDRGGKIIQMAKQFISLGLSCDFNILDMPIEKQQKLPGVNYIKEPFSYAENIMHIKNARAILEIMQGDTNGYTLRTWESIAFNKVLITNNSYLKEDGEFFDDNFTVIIGQDMNQELLNKITSSKTNRNKCVNKIRPQNFINYVADNIK